MRIVILANRAKPEVVGELEWFRPWLLERASIVAEPDVRDGELSDLPPADLAMVLGGDGTLLSQARRLLELDVPLLGVNFGKLGFLAEFTLEEVTRHWSTIAAECCRTSQRLVMQVEVYRNAAPVWELEPADYPAPRLRRLAVNDMLLTAGPPFRMVECELAIDPQRFRGEGTVISGDGLIVATASGSTAHNLSAGGSIVSPDVDALCITPVCPHSLAARPLIVPGDARVWIRPLRLNPGSTLVLDGQDCLGLEVGDQILAARHPRPLRLVHNPELNYWKMLARKMHWAARPTRS